MKNSVQITFGLLALVDGLAKSGSTVSVAAAVHSPYSAGYATGLALAVLLLTYGGARLLCRGLAERSMPGSAMRSV